MSRNLRLAPRSSRPRRLLCGLLAVAFVTAACSSSGDDGPPSYSTSDRLKVQVLPQLAATGEDTQLADSAAWVVDATVADEDEGTAVTLYARTGDGGWAAVSEEETDDKGHVALTSTTPGELQVIVGDDDDAIGTKVSTADAPQPTFTDDFEADTVDLKKGGVWRTREQGNIGLRTCSRADASAASVQDGVLQLSVDEDPEKEGQDCQLPGRRKQVAYRVNGHVGTEGLYSYTYGFAAARIRTQSARGQHSAFWMQAVGGQHKGGAKKGGAEIDVMEYFGDNHPQGGLTSFTYYLDKAGKKRTVGGWVPDLDQYGDDWSKKYHVFSVEWTPEEYVFRIDGQVTHRIEEETSGRPEFLILSLLSSDYELPRFNGELPEHMEVDWARVWETGPKS
ncbi:beta-glucanase (GH16 family) [Nocardioides sp. BE266]|uniref:glycoside hydrolase family 16 protein n=1 Tax=Nocardioides sp. BE266 TaxID=2817725 RepID=UPI00285C9DF6|nr:glycoside hydrolase family 16 protein [Nocardioides sp. BE266]MDR7252089.1 beta-glucanase (GH16 family) [Nocardioides sp. BE266]